MPVLKHYKGVCHIYADDSCDMTKAVPIIENAKMQYPSGCNALECLLVHADVAELLLPKVAAAIGPKGVKFKACERSLPMLGTYAEPATPLDWGFEFLDLILAVKIVDSLDEAMDFIAAHGSNHTESIRNNFV